MKEGGRLDDLDGMEVFEGEEVGVPRDDIVRVAFEGGSKELVIRGIHGEAISGVQVLGEQRLAKHYAKEAGDCLFLGLKAALNVGRGEDV